MTSDRGAGAAPSADAQERDHALVLIARAVHVRFALDAWSFADRLLELARAASRDPGRPPHEHLERLSLDDLYLATSCVKGDEQAWEEMTGRYAGFIRDFARRFLPGPGAQDLADQVIADLWERRKLSRYEGRSTLRTWLAAIVAHAALNVLKASRRSVPLTSGELRQWQRTALTRPSAATAEPVALLQEIVGQAIAGLPAADKLLLQLYYEQGLTLDEMTVVLRASKPTLSRRLKRTREALRASIDALAHARSGASADMLRAGVDLARLDFDLAAALGRSPALEGKPGGAV